MAQAPSWPTVAMTAEPGMLEDDKPGPHALQRPAQLGHECAHRLQLDPICDRAPPQQRRRGKHDREQDRRCYRHGEQRVLMAGEHRYRGEHDSAEDHQRQDIQDGLRDDRAQNHG